MTEIIDVDSDSVEINDIITPVSKESRRMESQTDSEISVRTILWNELM